MSNPLWVSEPDAKVSLRMGSSGASSIPPVTIITSFQNTVKKYGSSYAMARKNKINGVLPHDWEMWTWQEYWNECVKFAKSLLKLDVRMFRIVNILGFNSPEWFISNCGSIVAGCIAAGIYETSTPDACLYISTHSQAEVVVVENKTQLMKYAGRGDETPNLKCFVVYGEDIDPSSRVAFNVPIYSFNQFLALGTDVEYTHLEQRYTSLDPGNCSTLIYTSGTTGPPKAVMVSHDNITWTVRNMFDTYLDMGYSDRIVSFLPLSHIAGQVIDIHGPMYCGACTYFAQPDALRGTLVETLKDVRPTLFFGVPRVWEKIEEKLKHAARHSTWSKKMIARWAKRVAAKKSQSMQFGRNYREPVTFKAANLIVLSKVKYLLGLDQARYCFTGAAPISTDTLYYFASLDIPIYEVFGQSECTGPHTISCPGQWRMGFCGRPIPGTETITHGDTGELCYRGRHVFMGYMHMPHKMAETIDTEGYLHSGDIAEFDDNNQYGMPALSGFMKITGRIKDLIITAGGENIPPVQIENEVKTNMPCISNCVVCGDKMKYLTMLVALKTEIDPETLLPTNVLATEPRYVCTQIGSTARTVSQAASDPLWHEYINRGLEAVNAKAGSRAQVVQKWKFLPIDLCEKRGELTPTLKVKRSVVVEEYSDLIASMYTDYASQPSI